MFRSKRLPGGVTAFSSSTYRVSPESERSSRLAGRVPRLAFQILSSANSIGQFIFYRISEQFYGNSGNVCRKPFIFANRNMPSSHLYLLSYVPSGVNYSTSSVFIDGSSVLVLFKVGAPRFQRLADGCSEADVSNSRLVAKRCGCQRQLLKKICK